MMTVNDRILFLFWIDSRANTLKVKRLSESATLRHQLAADVLYLWLRWARLCCLLSRAGLVLVLVQLTQCFTLQVTKKDIDETPPRISCQQHLAQRTSRTSPVSGRRKSVESKSVEKKVHSVSVSRSQARIHSTFLIVFASISAVASLKATTAN